MKQSINKMLKGRTKPDPNQEKRSHRQERDWPSQKMVQDVRPETKAEMEVRKHKTSSRGGDARIGGEGVGGGPERRGWLLASEQNSGGGGQETAADGPRVWDGGAG